MLHNICKVAYDPWPFSLVNQSATIRIFLRNLFQVMKTSSLVISRGRRFLIGYAVIKHVLELVIKIQRRNFETLIRIYRMV